MTLLIAVFAAIISTLAWYISEKRDEMKLGFLSLMFWGASLMWFVDAVFEYAKLKAAYFIPTASEMLNDFFLGISVVAFGMVIWLVRVLISDPKGILRKTIQGR